MPRPERRKPEAKKKAEDAPAAPDDQKSEEEDLVIRGPRKKVPEDRRGRIRWFQRRTEEKD